MRRQLPLNALRAFEAAARHLSFAQAADELAVTPTAISHQIRSLEALVGAPLFRRRPRPIALTRAGLTLYPILREGFDDFAAALTRLRDDAPGGPVRVSTTPAFASRWLLPRLGDFRQHLGDMALEVQASEQPVDLRAGTADFVIRYAATPPDELEAQELFRDRYIAVCSPRLVEGRALPLTPRAVGDLPLIHFTFKRDATDPPSWRRWLAAAGIDGVAEPPGAASRALGFSEESHAIESALAGQGVALISDRLVAAELRAGVLVRVSDVSLAGFAFYAACLPDCRHRPTVEAFIAWAREQAAP